MFGQRCRMRAMWLEKFNKIVLKNAPNCAHVLNLNPVPPVTISCFEVWFVYWSAPWLNCWFKQISIYFFYSVSGGRQVFWVYWRLNSMLSCWAKYHDICSLSDAFRAWTPLTGCLIHLCLTPTGRRWAGTARPIWSSSSQPSVPSKNVALVSHKCP